ncbi:MAG: Metallophos domain-containing protein [Nitrospira sp.]|nr:MAG: Metallophos domain-containing protein [Nitrospira sp.]
MRIRIRNEWVALLPERALFWPTHSLLVVADCHLGKAETFQQQGLWLPSQSGPQDLKRLAALVFKVDAQHVLFLGDLVHSSSGVTTAVVMEFSQWLSEFSGSVQVVLGNHDAGLARRWPQEWAKAERCEQVRIEPFLFRHQPVDGPLEADTFYWVGHVHPMIQLAQGPDRVRLPGFVINDWQGVLPAFSSVSGGYDVSLRPDERRFGIAGDRIYEL